MTFTNSGWGGQMTGWKMEEMSSDHVVKDSDRVHWEGLLQSQEHENRWTINCKCLVEKRLDSKGSCLEFRALPGWQCVGNGGTILRRKEQIWASFLPSSLTRSGLDVPCDLVPLYHIKIRILLSYYH